jgi:hypothetical protein
MPPPSASPPHSDAYGLPPPPPLPEPVAIQEFYTSTDASSSSADADSSGSGSSSNRRNLYVYLTERTTHRQSHNLAHDTYAGAGPGSAGGDGLGAGEGSDGSGEAEGEAARGSASRVEVETITIEEKKRREAVHEVTFYPPPSYLSLSSTHPPAYSLSSLVLFPGLQAAVKEYERLSTTTSPDSQYGWGYPSGPDLTSSPTYPPPPPLSSSHSSSASASASFASTALRTRWESFVSTRPTLHRVTALLPSAARAVQHAREVVWAYLLPAGYPASVSSRYWGYAVWSMGGSVCCAAAGVLSTQAMLCAIGLGATTAIGSAAALNWVVKDGLGQLGGNACFLLCLVVVGLHHIEWLM